MIFKELQTDFLNTEIFANFQNYPFSFLLESANHKHPFGRYSFFGFSPFLIFKSKGEKIEVFEGSKRTSLRGSPWEILNLLINRYSLDTQGEFLPCPFISGAVGYFAYDLGRHLEDLPTLATDDLNLPDCYLGFYDTVVALDHWEKKGWICSTGLGEKNEKLRKKRAKDSVEKIEQIIYSSESPSSYQKCQQFNSSRGEFFSNFSREDYLKAICKVKDYIAQGEIYQVNLSQRFMGTVPEWGLSPALPWEVYKTLRKINPAPFAAYLNFPEVKVVSASPERFLRMSGKKTQTRPIKGTRPRGKNLTEDGKLAQELLNSKKDRAELVMIVDLERNDLGRVCEYGTVKVPKLVTLEKHPTVYHLVGTVEGVLREDKSHLDCLRACFPGGSITGAPKIRSMEIIEELEPTRRNIYTGAIGYLGFNGESDLNIVIRTLIFTPLEIPKTYRGVRNFYTERAKVPRFLTGFTQSKVYFQVGGGIVVDSDPEMEYQETLDKGKALFACLNGETIKLNKCTEIMSI